VGKLAGEVNRLRKLVWYNKETMTTDYHLEPSPRGVVIRFKKRKDVEDYKRFVRRSLLPESHSKMSIVRTTYVDGYIWSEETIK